MASIEPQIKPNGISQKNLVDLLYMIGYSIAGICTKLNADAGVPLTTYVANVITAIFNGEIRDSRGNYTMNRVSTADDRFHSISPEGMTDEALLEFLYQLFDMMETLTEQLDTDVLSDSDYEALVYTALYLWKIENCKGNTLGNGTVYYFRPGGVFNYDQLVDLLYAIVYSIKTLTEKLDADETVTDVNYTALWYTATILMRVENSKGSVVGNSPTTLP